VRTRSPCSGPPLPEVALLFRRVSQAFALAVVLHLATFSPWRERDRRGILATVASKSPRDKSITRDQLASGDNEGGATPSNLDTTEETQAALAEEEENI